MRLAENKEERADNVSDDVACQGMDMEKGVYG